MTGSVSAMTMTASERDALEQGIRMALSHASERKMTAAMLEVYQPADAHDARVESEAWAALAAVALRELERAGGRDAIAERLRSGLRGRRRSGGERCAKGGSHDLCGHHHRHRRHCGAVRHFDRGRAAGGAVRPYGATAAMDHQEGRGAVTLYTATEYGFRPATRVELARALCDALPARTAKERMRRLPWLALAAQLEREAEVVELETMRALKRRMRELSAEDRANGRQLHGR